MLNFKPKYNFQYITIFIFSTALIYRFNETRTVFYFLGECNVDGDCPAPPAGNIPWSAAGVVCAKYEVEGIPTIACGMYLLG